VVEDLLLLLQTALPWLVVNHHVVLALLGNRPCPKKLHVGGLVLETVFVVLGMALVCIEHPVDCFRVLLVMKRAFNFLRWLLWVKNLRMRFHCIGLVGLLTNLEVGVLFLAGNTSFDIGVELAATPSRLYL